MKPFTAFAATALWTATLTGWLFSAHAEVVTDGSVGPAGVLVGKAYEIGGVAITGFEIDAGLGRQAGGNLFHSFSRFNLSATEAALFNGPPGVERIVSRVTGGTVSHLDGLIYSDIAGADLYFLNPAGVVFGEHAALSVPESFYVSSAAYLKLADGARFDAEQPEQSVFSSAPPRAFGFGDADAGSLRVTGSRLYQMPADGQPDTLALVGGDIHIEDAVLWSWNGRLALASVAEAGEVPVQVEEPALSAYGGRIEIRDSTEGYVANRARSGNLSTLGEGGGRIVIRGGQVILDNAYVFADTIGNRHGAGVEVRATESVVLDNAARITADSAQVTGRPVPVGNAGQVTIAAPSIEIRDASQITGVSVNSDGAGGDIRIQARELLISGARNFKPEVGEDLIVAAGVISSTGGGTGNGGSVHIRADTLHLADKGTISANTGGQGNAGNIRLEVGDLSLEDGATLETAAGDRLHLTATGGQGGSLIIEADGQVMLSGSYTALTSNTFGAADAGHIDIRARHLQVQDGARIESGTASTGNGGRIAIKAGTVTLNGDARLSSSAEGHGRGGSIVVGSAERPVRQLVMDNSLVTVLSRGQGDAGDIEVHGADFHLTDAVVTAQANAAGGGNLRLGVSGFMDVRDSTLSAKARGLEATDAGGNIELQTPEVAVLHRSRLNASARGGPGGNIFIVAETFVQSADSTMNVTSALNVDGRIRIESVSGDNLENLLLMPGNLLDADTLLRDACRRRSSRPPCRFMKKPRRPGGFMTPDDWQASGL